MASPKARNVLRLLLFGSHLFRIFGFSRAPWPSLPRGGHILRHASPARTATDTFTSWVLEKGLQAPKLEIGVFDGVRGVRVTESIDAREALVSVPQGITLETTSLSRVPAASMPEGWVGREFWAGTKWYYRLALMLVRERELGSASAIGPYLDILPASFDELPLYWSNGELEALQYPALLAAVDTQRTEYHEAFANFTASRGRAAGFPEVSRETFEWAVHCVRSRAFSGVYEGSRWEERVTQVGFTGILAAGAFGLHLADPEQIINGVFAVLLTTVMRDFLLTTSGSLKRFVLCPFVDLFNHRSYAASDVSYEYFANTFTTNVAMPLRKDDEAVISYGKRSNDQFMLLYGFVEADNPNDQFQFCDFLEVVELAMEDVRGAGIPAGRLGLLQQLDLVDAAQKCTATANGIVDEAMRAMRVLVASEQEIRGDDAALRVADARTDSDLNDRANQVLAKALEIHINRMATTLDEDKSALARCRGTYRERLALEFRISKKIVLSRCLDTIKASLA